jgi:hypothetical protein
MKAFRVTCSWPKQSCEALSASGNAGDLSTTETGFSLAELPMPFSARCFVLCSWRVSSPLAPTSGACSA